MIIDIHSHLIFLWHEIHIFFPSSFRCNTVWFSSSLFFFTLSFQSELFSLLCSIQWHILNIYYVVPKNSSNLLWLGLNWIRTGQQRYQFDSNGMWNGEVGMRPISNVNSYKFVHMSLISRWYIINQIVFQFCPLFHLR